MEEVLTFETLVEVEHGEVMPFQPDYTEDFSKYMRESIRQSEQMSREAMNSAASVIIYQ
ncbi:MAG: hypothetical protein IJ069_02010 [Prevotella sp.]|nr:hypothetical protein [Prevotella sp.]MBQ8152442.1 hypothetical protein [Prevotella sp.]